MCFVWKIIVVEMPSQYSIARDGHRRFKVIQRLPKGDSSPGLSKLSKRSRRDPLRRKRVRNGMGVFSKILYVLNS